MPRGRHLGTERLPLAQGIWGYGCDPGQAVECAEAREPAAEEAGGRSGPGQGAARRGIPGKLLSPKRRRQAVTQLQSKFQVSERRACRAVQQPRSSQRYVPTPRADEDALTQAIVALAEGYGRYGYRRITALLKDEGWAVGKDRVQRIWRREGLKVPKKQPKRGRLWLNDRSCIRLRPIHPQHVWSYDFVHYATDDGRSLKLLTLIDESTRECLAIRVKRKLNSIDVIDTLTDLFILRGIPAYIRSDNGLEFVAQAVTD